MVRLTIMRGLPGSGKSTIARAMDTCDGNTVVVSADDFFMDDDGNYKFDVERLGDAHENCKQLCAHYLSEGRDVVVDNTNIRAEHIFPYIKMGVEHGAKIRIVAVDLLADPEELALSTVHGVPVATIERMADSYEDIDLPAMIESAQEEIDAGV